MRYNEITESKSVEVIKPILRPELITRLLPELKQVLVQLEANSKIERNNIVTAQSAEQASEKYLELVSAFGNLVSDADADELRDLLLAAQVVLSAANSIMSNLAACRRIQNLFPKFGALVGEMRHGTAAIIKYCIDARSNTPRSVSEAESLPYEVIDQMNELRDAINQVWKPSAGKSFIPASVQDQVKTVLADQDAGRSPLYRALDQLWKYCDQDAMPRQVTSTVRTLLSSSGHLK